MGNEGLRTYRDLIVWQEAMDLVEACYELTETFPARENFGLTSQIRRCAVSIPTNIAEGYGRDSGASYVHFLKIARGSVRELDTLLLISARVKATTPEAAEHIASKLDRVARLLHGLIRSVERSAQIE